MINAKEIESLLKAGRLFAKWISKFGMVNQDEYFSEFKLIFNTIEGFFGEAETNFYISRIEQIAPLLRACHVEIVKGLIFCGRYEEALSQIRAGVMSHGINCFTKPLLLRAFLGSNIQGRIDLIDGETYPSWLLNYVETGKDTFQSAIFLDFQIENFHEHPVLLCTVRCPCCARVLRFDLAKDFIKAGKTICCHCYAALQIESETLAAVGKNYFLTFLNLQPRDGNGLIASIEALTGVARMAVLLKPLIFIRFGKLRTERIGHQVINATHYLNSVKPQSGTGFLDVLGGVIRNGAPFIANHALQVLINDALAQEGVMIDPVGCQLGDALSQESCHNITKYTFDLFGYPNVDSFQKTLPLKFSTDQIEFCREKISEMGIPDGAPYVCLHVRTSHYLREQFNDTANAFAYHDYRDSDINDYVEAVKFLNERGIYVLRMGAVAGLPELNYNSHMYIDYALNFRSEIMDVYLSLNCKFMISTGSGIDMLPWSSQVPLLIVNVHPISFWAPENPWLLLIAKRLRCKKLGRFLSLMEQYELGGGYYRSQHIAARGLEIVDNTPDEIATATREMLLLLDNEWFPSPEYLRRRDKLRSAGQYVTLLRTKRATMPRIGQDFLLQNTWDL